MTTTQSFKSVWVYGPVAAGTKVGDKITTTRKDGTTEDQVVDQLITYSVDKDTKGTFALVTRVATAETKPATKGKGKGTTAPAPAPAASVTDGVDPAMLAAIIAALKTPSA